MTNAVYSHNFYKQAVLIPFCTNKIFHDLRMIQTAS